ncbi:hypothetical protein ETAE_2833 [Edwardsiella piscicida]|uniref:Uncharacterized protein n=2 Tax=Edwardsiella TaxID=635 RepID=A0A0H3DTU2_EDWTF|nr:hypothetical protein ETAE_2833 [Edwardsiella tarda EIB202]ADM42672.1 hypothetical protein ETAF_2570 [Edwardsiella tarda FL6-60]ARD18928.1 hypothetical protein BXA22_11550 [Edwardsiella piscicida]QBB12967.1 hypothetical protein EVK84_10715 [Edwardsiella piscicida]
MLTLFCVVPGDSPLSSRQRPATIAHYFKRQRRENPTLTKETHYGTTSTAHRDGDGIPARSTLRSGVGGIVP